MALYHRNKSYDLPGDGVFERIKKFRISTFRFSAPPPGMGVNIYPEVSRSLISVSNVIAPAHVPLVNLSDTDVNIDALVNQGVTHTSPITT